MKQNLLEVKILNQGITNLTVFENVYKILDYKFLSLVKQIKW